MQFHAHLVEFWNIADKVLTSIYRSYLTKRIATKLYMILGNQTTNSIVHCIPKIHKCRKICFPISHSNK